MEGAAMSDAFISEIRMFADEVVPTGWLACDGQILPIKGNEALYSLIGTTFGGDGQTNFAIPDLRGRVAMHLVEQNTTYAYGKQVGSETHMLSQAEMPGHTHQLAVSNTAATTNVASGNAWANTGTANTYAGSSNTQMNINTLAMSGSSQPHSNMQPYSVANFCICVEGTYPPPSY
jgi:microcystin-dependent protein